MRSVKFILIGLLLLSACALQQNAVQTELHFGRSQLNGGMVSDSAWDRYANDCLGHIFTSGFSTLKGNGKWLNTDTRQIESEPSMMVIAVNKKSRRLSRQVDSAIAVYKHTFQQQSVLRVDKKVKMQLK
jgi:hypothetical protein